MCVEEKEGGREKALIEFGPLPPPRMARRLDPEKREGRGGGVSTHIVTLVREWGVYV